MTFRCLIVPLLSGAPLPRSPAWVQHRPVELQVDLSQLLVGRRHQGPRGPLDLADQREELVYAGSGEGHAVSLPTRCGSSLNAGYEPSLELLLTLLSLSDSTSQTFPDGSFQDAERRSQG